MRTISSNVYKKPFMTTGPAVGWVGETDVRTQTASPILDELSFPAMELYARPAATATLLEESAVNIDEWLAQEVVRLLRPVRMRRSRRQRLRQKFRLAIYT